MSLGKDRRIAEALAKTNPKAAEEYLKGSRRRQQINSHVRRILQGEGNGQETNGAGHSRGFAGER